MKAIFHGAMLTAAAVFFIAVSPFAHPAHTAERKVRPMSPTLLRPIPGFELVCTQTTLVENQQAVSVPITARVDERGGGSRLILETREPQSNKLISLRADFGSNGQPSGSIRIKYDGQSIPGSDPVASIIKRLFANMGNVAHQGKNLTIGVTRQDVQTLLGFSSDVDVTVETWRDAGQWVGETDLKPFGAVLLAEWSVSSRIRSTAGVFSIIAEAEEFYDPQSGLKVSSLSEMRFDGADMDFSITERVTCDYASTPVGYSVKKTFRSPADAESRLRQVQELLEKRLITEGEAAEKRREILEGL